MSQLTHTQQQEDKDKHSILDLNKSKAIIAFTSDLITKLHSDYLLLNRICYKVKHQYRKQKQFQYVTQYKKGLRSLFQLNTNEAVCTSKKTKDQIINHLFINKVIDSKTIIDLQEVILKIGALMLEMLKLKLYPSYTIIILGIMSRANAIIDYLTKNKEQIAIAMIN